MPGAKSFLFLPPRQLSSCVAAGIFRDTRSASLSDMDRFNYFPASPLVTVTYVIEGELRLVQEAGRLDCARLASPLASRSILPPQDRPTTSWSPGPVAALTIGFYPDAWSQLGHSFDGEAIPEPLAVALSCFDKDQKPATGWEEFSKKFVVTWQQARGAGGKSDWPGSDRVSDWSRYLLSRLSTVGPGRSIRTLERRLKSLSGQTRQSLNFYSAIENLHQRVVESPDENLADIANDAGFSDQSHMGRAVRRATGFSPRKLNHLIETEEAFWCYRLMGERF